MKLRTLFTIVFVQASLLQNVWAFSTRRDVDITGEQRIQVRVNSFGYPLEEHFVQTADGYILAVHRIPHGRETGDTKQPRKIVFLMHGLLCSSNDWILAGPEKGLAFLLVDAGYDVWMGNARGNTYSRNHAWLTPKGSEFWSFSWHEIGVFDLPAMIDYVLEQTRETSLHYIGHSQGTTSFFVMSSVRPEYGQKIKVMHALAPVAFMSNAPSPFFKALAPLVGSAGTMEKLFGSHEFMPNSELFEIGGSLLCKDEALTQDLCANVLFLISGFDSENLNKTMIPDIMAVTPAGASANQIIHYAQGSSGKFRFFDYGLVKNTFKYGSLTPPEYTLQAITAPVALYYGNNDWLAGVKDVQELAGKLGNLLLKYEIPFPKWNHLDFLWGISAKELVYDKVMEVMSAYP
ncbi:unnamed protein product [Hermetia illucens]|uniref:Lipase n=1 Tax=Hermetia illucens TaxID=343691 RepID=A0A7R8UKZ0_HERIL|nr:lipase 3-like [Hermetia illucens]CAD7082798.1 unnamed protein product [Hermetia illucens]